jgi:hypothetical protein
MPSITITRGLVDPLAALGFPTSAGVQLSDGHRLYAIFEQHSRRVMLVAHPVRHGDMTAVALSPWTGPRQPLAGDLLDELVDPAHAGGIALALQLLRDGSL